MSTLQQTTTDRGTMSARQLVQHLNSLVTNQDLGALALLRRGLGRDPGEVPEIYAHVLPYLADSDTASPAQRGRGEDAGLLVASLYALWHQGKATPSAASGIGLGAAFRQLRTQSDSTSIEQRFAGMLKASRNRLPDQLRHAVTLLRAKGIALDWEQLFRDIYQWDETDRRARHPARRRWARDFWGYVGEPEGPRPGGGEGAEDDDDDD